MYFDDAILKFGFDCKARELSPKTIDNYRKQLLYQKRYLYDKYRIQEVEKVSSPYMKQFLVSMDGKRCRL